MIAPGEARLSQSRITELLYRHDVARLRSDVINYLRNKDSLWLLFDNVDKGWPTRGIRPDDLIIIRTLLDASRKLQQQLAAQEIDAHTVIFLRNDVFDLLVEETSDRGKEAKASVDWTDSDLLREMLRRRLVHQTRALDARFEEVWTQICISHYQGEETSAFFIERSLMRPRALLNLVGHCRSCAVNLGHARIEADDIKKGYSLYSTDLVSEIGLEIRDVMPEAEDVLYGFIGYPKVVNEAEIEVAFGSVGLTSDQRATVLDLLLWYGVLGLMRPDGDIDYVYSLNYDMRLLKGKIRQAGIPMFGVNPAFWPGLGIGT